MRRLAVHASWIWVVVAMAVYLIQFAPLAESLAHRVLGP